MSNPCQCSSQRQRQLWTRCLLHLLWFRRAPKLTRGRTSLLPDLPLSFTESCPKKCRQGLLRSSNSTGCWQHWSPIYCACTWLVAKDPAANSVFSVVAGWFTNSRRLRHWLHDLPLLFKQNGRLNDDTVIQHHTVVKLVNAQQHSYTDYTKKEQILTSIIYIIAVH